MQGVVATRFTERERKIDVRTRLPEKDLTTVATLAAPADQSRARRLPLPLSAVATIEVADGPAEIRHVGGRRAEIVSADLAGLDLRGAGRKIEARAESLRLRPSATSSMPSSSASRARTRSRRGRWTASSSRSALATFLVYLLMAAQFESLLHPFVIMFTIPLALIGVVFAMRVFSISISVMVFIGAILLVGVVVDNAIILIDSVNGCAAAGWHRNDALDRGRPRSASGPSR